MASRIIRTTACCDGASVFLARWKTFSMGPVRTGRTPSSQTSVSLTPGTSHPNTTTTHTCIQAHMRTVTTLDLSRSPEAILVAVQPCIIMLVAERRKHMALRAAVRNHATPTHRTILTTKRVRAISAATITIIITVTMIMEKKILLS